ncbi:class I SAM-dependent methyltransferase [uncultured Kocuria sp.]|uniref:class I SAM-dependent methyltransferase n=1 Tax=uncultured Kocuria sp. TaxID=259305 RepID=UPI0025942195|nr:class I SAM-dependent methyltransferase [uncultured Kocuria sp.]MCT1367809.1 methyltransferase domain-containing protein [Rothia sp. p3-SID1597]
MTMHHAHNDDATTDPREFWENRYSSAERIWSGRPNATLVGVVEDLPAGRSVDLGCGEGADVLWLASAGWEATGVDISATAVARARAAAEDQGLSEAAHFEAMDLAEWRPEEPFDLVTASFLQSPVELDRVEILRRASSLVAEGGRLCIISHAAPPPWSESARGHGPGDFPQPEEDLDSLNLGAEWTTEICEVRRREAEGPNGELATLLDSVVVTRRRG